MIIDKTLGNICETEIGNRKVETILVDHHNLAKPHQKLRTESGEVFAISLDFGCSLEPGEVIFADEERIVCVELVPEKCIVVRPEGNVQWARAAFNIGNMHQAAYIHDDFIVVAYDAILESVIRKLGIKYSCEERKLNGIRANIVQGEGHHPNDHKHGYHHHHEGE